VFCHLYVSFFSSNAFKAIEELLLESEASVEVELALSSELLFLADIDWTR